MELNIVSTIQFLPLLLLLLLLPITVAAQSKAYVTEHRNNTARTRPRGGTPNGAQSSRSTQKIGRRDTI
jgi:hypothetical protein